MSVIRYFTHAKMEYTQFSFFNIQPANNQGWEDQTHKGF